MKLPTRHDGQPARYESIHRFQTRASLKVSCISVSCVLCYRCRLCLLRIVGSMVVRSWGRNQKGRIVSELRSSRLSAQVRRVCSCKSCSYYQMDEFRRLRRSQVSYHLYDKKAEGSSIVDEPGEG